MVCYESVDDGVMKGDQRLSRIALLALFYHRVWTALLTVMVKKRFKVNLP